MDNIEIAIATLESRMAKSLKGINDSIDARIATSVKAQIANSIEFQVNNHLKAIQNISVDKALSVEQLTRLYQDVYQALQDLKLNTNGYGLYEQMQQLNNAFQSTRSELQTVSNNVEKLINNKYIEAEITKEQLKGLYDQTNTSGDELARQFKMSVTEAYNVLNCKRKDIKMRNEFKLYLEKKLQKQKDLLNATV
jgi:2-hydroxy-3-keto-5-methylthiopentenyl-1-phosphate phosphatase